MTTIGKSSGQSSGLACEPVKAVRSMRQPSFACAVCGTRGMVLSSEEITTTLRRLYYRCDNLLCGHTWKAHLEYIETLSPSSLGTVKDPAPMLRLKNRQPRRPTG